MFKGSLNSFCRTPTHEGILNKCFLTRILCQSAITQVQVVKTLPSPQTAAFPFNFYTMWPSLCLASFMWRCKWWLLVDLNWVCSRVFPTFWLSLGYTERKIKANFAWRIEMRRQYAQCSLACATWREKTQMPLQKFTTLLRTYVQCTNYKVPVSSIISVWYLPDNM